MESIQQKLDVIKYIEKGVSALKLVTECNIGVKIVCDLKKRKSRLNLMTLQPITTRGYLKEKQ